ncbi:MAG TPA: hypothetical protein VK540_02575 [Polyangiaceae bacterium]|jgi:hypothetical protein|nr:hypothetical protein [Polyangiaceae bacterium]
MIPLTPRRLFRPTFRVAPSALALAIALGTSQPAAADGPAANLTDGVYGRFDGDLDLSLAGGATFGSTGPTAAVIGRAIFFQTAGLYTVYTDALGRSDVALPRSLGVGVTLRPFFVPRWALDLEHGPAILDLTIDAISFDMGVLWPSNRDGSFTERPGMETALGTEVPLFGKASGPFLGARGALRWRSSELAGHSDAGLKPVLFVTLAWHALIDAHIVDVGDRRLR